jgi:hypothetical protein
MTWQIVLGLESRPNREAVLSAQSSAVPSARDRSHTCQLSNISTFASCCMRCYNDGIKHESALSTRISYTSADRGNWVFRVFQPPSRRAAAEEMNGVPLHRSRECAEAAGVGSLSR